MDVLIGWIYRLPEEIIGSLERKEPHALVILAHWAVLLKSMNSAWFMVVHGRLGCTCAVGDIYVSARGLPAVDGVAIKANVSNSG